MEATRQFISGNEAVALGVKLARPAVISAYPISPQTIVVEKLSEYVDNGELDSEYLRVESEHSAISAVMGASALGVRTFTATSSQGLLYMAEGLPAISGARYPVVMMNANRAVAMPWSIYNDHSDSLMMLNSGWLQVYVEDAQEALDCVIQAFRIAEDPRVSAPVMVNLDGFILTHTYEIVEIPSQNTVDAFLPPMSTTNKMSLENPVSMCISVGDDWHSEFRHKQHVDMCEAARVIKETDGDFAMAFGRGYGGLVEEYRCDDAEAVLVTMGSISSTVRSVVDKLRGEGLRVGLMRIRYMRPFPVEEFTRLGDRVRAVGVLDKDISYGFEGNVFTDVNSALSRSANKPQTINYIGGLSAREIPTDNIEAIFRELLGLDAAYKGERVKFINLRWNSND